VDIGFLLDGSGSVGNQGFLRVLNFVNQIVSAFNISRETAQAGVTEFSNKPVIHIKLDDFQDSRLLQDEISKIIDSGGRTRTDLSLQIMSQEFFTYENGSRAGVPKVLVLVTDGKSTGTQPLSESVKELRKKGVIIYSVGVGDNINMQELKSISRTERDVFVSKDFSSIGLIASPLVERIAGDLTGELRNQLSKHHCLSIVFAQLFSVQIHAFFPGFFLCSFLINITYWYRYSCVVNLGLRASNIDVIFAMGADGFGASAAFNDEKTIIRSILDSQGPAQAKYGLIQYGDNSAEILRHLSQYTNNLDFKSFVGTSTLKSRGRALIPAMNKASEMFSSSDAKQKVLVLFANGLPFVPFNDLVNASSYLRSQGVKVVVVYSGYSADHTRLLRIVSTTGDFFPWSIGTGTSVMGSRIAFQLFKGSLFILLPY
jgi:hypothetical protein